jgi:hypothetical protein
MTSQGLETESLKDINRLFSKFFRFQSWVKWNHQKPTCLAYLPLTLELTFKNSTLTIHNGWDQRRTKSRNPSFFFIKHVNKFFYFCQKLSSHMESNNKFLSGLLIKILVVSLEKPKWLWLEKMWLIKPTEFLSFFFPSHQEAQAKFSKWNVYFLTARNSC